MGQSPTAPTGRGRQSRRRARRNHAEFGVYFTLVFLTALPATTLAWLFGARRRLGEGGPVARARACADTIAPAIFSA